MTIPLSKPEPNNQQALIPSTSVVTLSLYDGIKVPVGGYVGCNGLVLNEDSVIVYISLERNHVFLMGIRGSIKKPKRFELDQLQMAIKENQVKLSDTFIPLQAKTPYALLNEKQKETASRRFAMIENIVNDLEELFYGSYGQNKVKKAAKKYGVSTVTIYKYLWSYLYANKKISALAFGVGKYANHIVKERVITKPLGRPSRDTLDSGVETRKILDERDYANFEWALKLYGANGDTSAETIKASHEIMLYEHYAESIVLLDNKALPTSKGREVVTIKPEEECPSFGQYYYWLRKLNGYKHIAYRNSILPISENFKDFAGRKGDAYANIIGLGQRFELDETPFDEELTSKIFPGKKLGKATLYMLVDAYTDYIVGFYFTFGYPSVLEVSNALYQCFRDRRSWLESIDCLEYLDEWEEITPPMTLVVDNAEFNNSLSESIVKGLNVKIEFGKPGCGNDKPYIESLFSRTKGYLPHLSKAHKPVSQNGQRTNSARKHAFLTIQEVNRILMENCIVHNNYQINHSKELPREIIEDGVPPRPRDLVRWAIENGNSYIQPKVSDKELRCALLSQGKVTVKQGNIEFSGHSGKLYFVSPQVLQLGLQDRPYKGKSRSHTFECRFNPHDVSKIWVYIDGVEYDAFLDQNLNRYEGMDAFERESLDQLERLNNAKVRQEELNAKASQYHNTKSILKEARENVENIDSPNASAQKIRENRKLEHENTTAPLAQLPTPELPQPTLDDGNNNNNKPTKKTSFRDEE